MKLAVITTFGFNSGDNFIYEGFKNLFPVESFESVFLINKIDIPRNNTYKELIDVADLIVICGSPIFYDKCYRMKWQNKVQEYSKISGKKIMLLAVGSNFKCSTDGSVSVPDVIQDKNYTQFVKKYEEASFGDFTVRDRYCLEFIRSTGITDIKQIICPSLFAGNVDKNQKERDLIFIIWGDILWNCNVPSQRVLEMCGEIKNSLSSSFKDKKIVWVCHDFESYKQLLKQTDKNDILYSNNYIDFLKFYSRCFFAFSVKVHGTMLLASMGVPSLLLQLDSRASIVEPLDESYAILSNPVEQLTNMCLEKIKGVSVYRDKIIALKHKYKEEYEEMFSKLGLL
jgi:hypothetical protein